MEGASGNAGRERRHVGRDRRADAETRDLAGEEIAIVALAAPIAEI